MARRPSSPAGRALFFLIALSILILAVYDLFSPNSLLLGLWQDLFSGRAPVEGVRDNLVDRLGIPR